MTGRDVVRGVVIGWMAIVVGGCGHDDASVPTAASQPFTGIFASGTDDGKLAFTVATPALAPRAARRPVGPAALSASVPVTGLLRHAAGSIALSGHYDTDLDSLVMSGGGYTFTAHYRPHDAASEPSDAGFSGVYGGPDGGGEFHVLAGAEPVIQRYCGRCTSSRGFDGRWIMVVGSASLVGVAVSDSLPARWLGFDGALGAPSSGIRAIQLVGGDGHDDIFAGSGSIAPALRQASGSWSVVYGVAETGHWMASPCP